MSGVFDGARAGAQAGGAFSGAKANAGLSAESPKKKAEKARLRAESEKRFQGSTATAGVSTEKPKKGKTVDFPSGRSYQWDGSDQDAQRIKDAERYLMDETAMGRYSSKPPRREPGGNAQVLNSGVGQFGKFVTDLGNEVYDKTTTAGVNMGMTPSEKFIAGQGAGLIGGGVQAGFTALGGLLQAMGSDSTPEMRMKGGAESAFEIGGGALIGKLGGLLKKIKGGAKGAAEGVEAGAKAADVPTPKPPAVEPTATPTAPPKKGPKLKNSEKLVEDVTYSFREPTGKATLSKKSRDMMDRGETVTTNDNYTDAFQQSIDNLNGAKQTTKASPTMSPEKEIAQLRTKVIRGQATDADRVRLRELEAPETVKMTSPSPVKETVTAKGGRVLTKAELLKADAPNLDHAIEARIPVSKIDGLDPSPADWVDDAGNVRQFEKGGKITKRIEVEYDPATGKYTLYDGNHRVKQAILNGDTDIDAFVYTRNKADYAKIESKPPTTPIAEAKGATTPAKGRSRPYMLGGQEGARATVTFADEAQQAWYDAAAKEFGARNKRYDLIGKGAQKPTKDEIIALGRKEGLSPEDAMRKAKEVYDDVRGQMKGAKDGDIRILQNNFGKASAPAMQSGFTTEQIGKGLKETNRLARWSQLGADAGVLLRQGGSAIVNHPRAWWDGVKKGLKAAKSDEALDSALDLIENRKLDIQRKQPDGSFKIETLDMADVRQKAGLSITGKGTKEEGFASSIVEAIGKKIPGISNLERFQTAFINSVRAEMFDDFVASFPDATAKELADRAKYINSALGRSNAQAVSELAESLMTSPRWTRSRWEMAANIAKSGKWAIAAKNGDKAATQNLLDLGRHAGSIIALTGAAKAAGVQIELTDPSSPDFLKWRVGNTIYDPTAGIAAPIRTVLRLYYMTPLAGKNRNEITPQKNPLGEVANQISYTLGPGPRMGTNALFGKSIGGYDLKDDEKGLAQFMPLIAKGISESWSEDGPTAALARGATEFLGVNSNRYPAKGPEAPKPPKRPQPPKRPSR